MPGFQKCSIAAICDVGKEEAVYGMYINESTGLEDREFTLTNQVNAFLGYHAVAEVIYDATKNPNRLSVDFIDYRTRNAERIELFCNARESEVYGDTPIFVCSEHIRQVTFGGSADVDDENKLTGNLLTAAYLDPQGPLFFDEPSKPVAIYSHVLKVDRVL